MCVEDPTYCRVGDKMSSVSPEDVQQTLLIRVDAPEEWRPDVDQQDPEHLHIKEEEEELWTSLEGDQLSVKDETDASNFSFTVVSVKSEDDEEKPLFSQLHQHQLEDRDVSTSSSADQMKVEADGEDWGGAETSRNPDLNPHGDASIFSETEFSADDEEDEDGNNPDAQHFCGLTDLGRISRRERTAISEEHKALLQNFYQQGMTRVGSPLIAAAAEVTGLAPAVIDNWIGNYRRSLKMSSFQGTKGQKKRLYTRNLSAYNLFCRDLLRNKGNLKDIKQKWSSLGEAQRKKYVEEAAALKAEGRTGHLSPEMRRLKIKKHLKQLKLKVSSLEMLGVETAVMLFDCQKPNIEVLELRSKGAAAFLDSMDTFNSFALHFKESSSSASAANAAKEPVDALVKKVQDLFNKKYHEAGGRGRLPYQSLQNHSIIINASGLPDGLTLKKPSYYGRKQLEDLLMAAEQISFQIDPERDIQSQTVEDNWEAMCVNKQ